MILKLFIYAKTLVFSILATSDSANLVLFSNEISILGFKDQNYNFFEAWERSLKIPKAIFILKFFYFDYNFTVKESYA